MEAEEKKCPQCAEMVKAGEKVCRFCGYYFENYVSSNIDGSPIPNVGQRLGRGCLIALAIIVAFGIIGSLVGPGKKTALSSNTAASDNVIKNAVIESDAPVIADKVTANSENQESVPSSGIFGPQGNAARSAQQYLGMTGFSRRGLIEQLSSDAGNRYSVADATAAVDSLTVDWNG